MLPGARGFPPRRGARGGRNRFFAEQRGVGLRLVRPAPTVRRLLQLTGAEALFSAYDDPEQALA
ncbi:hypothetical protein [Streptomyces sp. NPDC048527]|uniref:hypothetical protein n=1 Tax=Streptomyces sp. NPDC048527 TaxID=3365568 RepID=UPI003714BDCF